MAIEDQNGDVYSQIMDTEGQDQASALKQSMFVGTKSNPDEAAKAATLAQTTGLPADVVSRNKDTVEQAAGVDSLDYGSLIDNNPGLSKFLQSPDNAKVAHDDLDNLGQHENQVKEYGLLQSLWHSLNSGMASADASIARVPALAVDAFLYPGNLFLKATGQSDKQVRSPDWLRNNPVAKYYDAQQEAWSVPELSKSIIGQAAKGDFAGAGRSLVAQVVANAPNQAIILASAMSGAPMAGLGYAGATQAAQANKTAQESGVDPASATTDAIAQGSLEMLLENAGTLGMFRKWENAIAESVGKESARQVMSNVGKTIAYSAFAEGNEEFLTQAGQDFSDYVTGVNPDAMTGIWQRAVDAGLVGAASGASMTAPAAVTTGAQRGKQIRQAEQAKEFYLSLGNTAEASKLRERLPEAHRAYVEGLVKDGPVENIYIPVEAWDMFMQTKGVDPAASAGEIGVSAQYDQAKQTGTNIKIPLATWANKVVGTEYYQGLADDMKFDPAAQTVNEVKAEGERIKEELAKADEQAKAAASQEIATPDAKKILDEQTAQVQQKVAEQLKATGKFADKDIQHLSSLWSNFARVFGGRVGKMPLDFFNQSPVTVKTAENLDQTNQPGQTELNQFAGPEAINAPLAALDRANTQEQFGVSPEAIRQETGWFRGMDKKWRYEISDKDVLVQDGFSISDEVQRRKDKYFKKNPSANPDLIVLRADDKVGIKLREDLKKQNEAQKEGYPLQEVYNHPKLFAAYPALETVRVKFVEREGSAAASFNPKTNVIELNERANQIHMTQSLVHEIQHAIQEIENFGRGGSVNQFWLSASQAKPLQDKVEEINKQLKESVGKPEYQDLLNQRQEIVDKLQKGSFSGAFDQYANLAGEVEARDVAQRAFMDEQQRQDQSPDIRNNATVIFGGKEFTLTKPEKNTYFQGQNPLGAILFGKEGGFDIRLLKDMNYSTFIHETGHAFLEMMRRASVQTDVPQDIADMEKSLFKWLGIESWDQLERKHHEQFATGFEKFLAEGRAPSEGLRKAFARFKVWLISVYKTLQNINVDLSDDIRNVMGRLIATDDEIAQAQSEQGQQGMIQDPVKILGEENGQRYLDAVAQVKQEAEDTMTLRVMEDYQRERKSWWMEGLKKVRADVAQEVNARPEQIALSILQRGKMPDGTVATGELAGLKLNAQDLIRYYSNKYDLETTESDLSALEKEFAVENLEATIKDIQQFREDVGKIKRYKDDYLKEELNRIPKRYMTTNKFAKTLYEAASDLGFESDQALIEKMIENENALKDATADLVQARKELRSVKKVQRVEKFKAVKEAMSALPRGITGKDGQAVDIVGQIFGFSSPEQFLDILTRARPRNELIKEISHQRMTEEHGELYGNKQEMHDAALQAVHNDKREQVLRMELEYLAQHHTPVLKDLIRTFSARIPSSQVVKKYAADLIGKTTINELSPYQYQLAERRFAKEAGQLVTQGKFAEAFEAKKKELLNYELYRAAVEARNTIKKSLANFKNLQKTDDKLAKSRDLDYVNAARAILAMHGLGESTDDPYSFIKNTQAYDPDVAETLTALIDAATENAGDYKTITYDQFLSVKEAVDAIWEISRRSRQIEIDGKKMELEEVRQHLIDRIVQMVKPGKKAGYHKAATEQDKFVRALMGARAQGRRVEGWADVMDGGDSKGWFTRAIWNPVIQGTQEFRLKNKEYTQKFLELVKPLEKSLKQKQIISDELRYIFNSKAELLGALLHTGNESNLSKLLRGRGWGMYTAEGVLDTSRWDAFITRMQENGTLTKADYDFVQSVWNLFEEIKPATQKAHKEIYGYYYNTITAREFATPWGNYRGGYAPAVVDPFVSEDAAIRQEKEAAENSNNAYMFPTTGRGFTKGRVERYAAPLAMDLRLVPQHINKALRFAYIEPHVKDVGRIIRNQEFREYLRDLDPAVGQHMLSPWLQRAAQQVVETPDKGPGGWRFWRELRTRSGINLMAGNVVNTLQQFTGLSISAVKVKPQYLAAALFSYMKNPSQTAKNVVENSKFMATRSTTHIIEIQKTLEDLVLNQGKYAKAIDFAKKHAYFMQQGTQNFVDMVTWPAAYNQSVAQGNAHEQAVRDADAAVRLTQGDFSPENISNFEAGNSFWRAFTMFYSYFNMQANLLGSEFSKVGRELGLKRGAGRLFYIYLMGFMIPAVVSQVILKALSGEPWDKDDDGYLDDLLAIFFGSQFQTATAMFPFVGQAANVVVNKFNKKGYDDDIRTSPAITMLTSAASSPHSVYKAVFDEGSKKTAIHDVLSLIGLLTGAPVLPLSKPAGYLADVADGNVDPENPIDFSRGLITGKTGK